MKKLIAISLAALLMLALFITACAPAAEEEEEEAPTEVLLGATLPQTGIFSGFGEQGYGMQKAVDDINAQGGIYLSKWEKKVPVKLIIKDNQSDFTKVGPLSTDLVLTNKVHALLSPNAPCDLHDPTSVVANANKVPQIICGGPFEPWVNGARAGTTDKWPYTWFAGFAIGTPSAAPRNVPGYTMIDTWFMYMDRVGAPTNTNKITGVFASSDADGSGWYAAFPGLLRDHGYTVVGTDANLGLFPMTLPQDFTATINAWKAANVTILWGNCPGAHFGELWKQCYEQGFRPKIVLAARAALFPVDVISWGKTPPLGWGIGTEVWWSPHYAAADGFTGIGSRTAASLAADWAADTGKPLNRSIGSGYMAAQVMLDAIYRAGDVAGDAVNAKMATTDLNTIDGWVNFDSTTHFSAVPLSFGQWFYDTTSKTFTLYIVASALDSIPEEKAPIFPINTLYP